MRSAARRPETQECVNDLDDFAEPLVVFYATCAVAFFFALMARDPHICLSVASIN
jgi:hypothetical protein